MPIRGRINKPVTKTWGVLDSVKKLYNTACVLELEEYQDGSNQKYKVVKDDTGTVRNCWVWKEDITLVGKKKIIVVG